ncbi:rhodanese-related sulfurtransferase [Microbacteriaceae bacterium MWH-Ta3]|nr:rhodanese-related sulfurtransferase [Microbacteriaceae bacterium MWH-Ta3]
MTKLVASLALALSAAFGLTACAPAEPTVTVAATDLVIDVRTPAEFASGHLDGAVNIDIQGAAFTDLIGQLPTDGTYYIYCRSGNRSAQAIDYMESAGFTNVTNLGSVGDASTATGIAIVTD